MSNSSSAKHASSAATKPVLLGVKWENSAVSALLNKKAGDETICKGRRGQAIVSGEPQEGVPLTKVESEDLTSLDLWNEVFVCSAFDPLSSNPYLIHQNSLPFPHTR